MAQELGKASVQGKGTSARGDGNPFTGGFASTSGRQGGGDLLCPWQRKAPAEQTTPQI